MFLREVSRNLNLDTEIIQKDVFLSNKIQTGTIMARAFKPLPVVLELISKNFISYKRLTMYIAMNRFKIVKGKETEFENVWKNRDSHLEGVEGFKEFNLVKGNSEDSFTLYASHSIWDSEEAFLNWTKSKAFRLAHKGAGRHSDIYIGHPVFEGFKVII